ncbi:ImpA family metalloprotease [Microbulbifer sp. CAU 1566]|uniref:ImpA family metalloprotease n=1 Tax=Microbulbifer sp. CAU 1566 TaxID=2933269 RepID=UPI00200480E0|nr:ImpA family metalloprotease [Microbulbifer sp. CAU 1566]MCK7596455.1 ImpA family metalloprotease [Microbulbifer sp. CAU 1566]
MIFTLLALVGCGGGGSSSSDTPVNDPVENPGDGGDSGDSGNDGSDGSDNGDGQDDGDSSSPTPVSVALPDPITLYNDQVLNLTSSVSGDGTLTFQWQQVSGPAVTFTAADAAETEVVYPSSMQTETFEFRLTVSNETSSNSDTIAVTVKDRIDEAVAAGDPALLPAAASELEQRILDRVAERQEKVADFHAAIFGEGPIVFDPSRNSRYFSLDSLSDVLEVVNGNQSYTFVTATDKSGYRTVAMGDNVIVDLNGGGHTEFSQPMINLLDWLLAPQDASLSGEGAATVALMQMSSGNMSATESWLQAQNSQAVINRCAVEAELSSCLNGADLIITGATDTAMATDSVTAALQQAVNNQQSLLYVHTNSWNSTALTNPILSFFEVQTQSPGSAGNYFSQDAANWTSAAEMRANHSSLTQISSLVQHFKNNSFSFDISQCADEDNNCSNIAAYASEFSSVTSNLRGIPQRFDQQALDVFSIDGKYRLEKLLLLLADKYRESVDFPMWKDTTPTVDFLKAYFTDAMVYNSRQHNPGQPDLGNFSRADFSHITPVDKTVNLTSRRSFRAAGVYALPGQTFTVTRTDSNRDVDASVFINTQRTGSTRHMYPSANGPTWGYTRPKFLQSTRMPIKAGEAITVTSPYGGPVQIGFSDKGTDMTFAFSNVGQHPFWQTGGDDAAFAAALAADQYDWAEIVTDYFEVHSLGTRLSRSLSQDSRWDTPSEMETYITKYHHNYLRIAAGVQGEGIDVVPEIQNFAANYGFELAVWDQVQHGNMDQSTCGAGCSGNPYDATWDFSVLGHGDLHEVGHNVESGRFKFNGFEGHATTNFYSYYPKSRAQDEDGITANCQNLPFDTISSDLAASQGEADPAAYMAARGYSGWNYGVALIIEMMMHAEENGALDDGWNLIPRLHILERAFNAAKGNDSDWETGKVAVGFSSYTREQANAIDNNDWLLIATSRATGLDYRPYFDLIGQDYSAEADAQVASFAYPAVESAFYLPAANNAYCDALVGHAKQTY